MTNNRTLPQIAKAIKALEKKSIQSVVEIGKLLEEAAEKCAHGEYREWLKAEFSWSHDTARNYRSVYALAQKTKTSSFDKLDISISALYFVADLSKEGHAEWVYKAADAVIEAAKKGRVSYKIANEIYEQHVAKAESGRDVGGAGPPTDDGATPPDENPAPAAAAELPLPPEPGPEDWWDHLGQVAGEAVAMQALWTKEFGTDWEKFEVPSELLTLVKQAADAWVELKEKLSQSRKSSAVKSAADRAEDRASKLH